MNVLSKQGYFLRLLCAFCLSFALVLSGVGTSASKGRFAGFEVQKAYAVVPAVIPALSIALAACGISLTGIMAVKNLTFDDVVDAYEHFNGNIHEFIAAMTTGVLELANVPVVQFQGAIDFAKDLLGDTALFDDGSVNFDESFFTALSINPDQVQSLGTFTTQNYSGIQYVAAEYKNAFGSDIDWSEWFAFRLSQAQSGYQICIIPASTSAPLTVNTTSYGYTSISLPAHSYYAMAGYSSYLDSQKWVSSSVYGLNAPASGGRSMFWYGAVPAALGAVVGAGMNPSVAIDNPYLDSSAYGDDAALAAAAAAAAAASNIKVTPQDLQNAAHTVENGGNPDMTNLGQNAVTENYSGVLGQILNGILSIPRTIVNTGADVISGIADAVTSGVQTLVDTLADVIAKPIEAIKERIAPSEPLAVPSVWENFSQYLIFPLTIPSDIMLLFDLIHKDGAAPKVTIKVAAPEWLHSKSYSSSKAGLTVTTHSGSNTADVQIDFAAYAVLATFLRFALSLLWVFGLVNLTMRLVKVEESAVVGGSS